MLHSDSFNIASVLSPTASSAMPDLLSDRPPSPVAEFGMPADIGGAPLAPAPARSCACWLCILQWVLKCCTAGSDSIADCMSGVHHHHHLALSAVAAPSSCAAAGCDTSA